jgi:hypothetical protein
MAETGVNVDRVRVFGGPCQVYASVAVNTAQAARGVARIHSDWRLGSNHHILAKLLKKSVSGLSDLCNSGLDVPHCHMHHVHPSTHPHCPRIPHFLALAQMPAKRSLPNHIIALGKVKLPKVF